MRNDVVMAKNDWKVNILIQVSKITINYVLCQFVCCVYVYLLILYYVNYNRTVYGTFFKNGKKKRIIYQLGPTLVEG